MKRTQPLLITISTSLGSPPLRSDREQRRELWEDFCKTLVPELGPQTPQNIDAYEERLAVFNKQLNFPLIITRKWPASKAAFKHLTNELGSSVLTFEWTADHGLVGIVHVL